MGIAENQARQGSNYETRKESDSYLHPTIVAAHLRPSIGRADPHKGIASLKKATEQE